MKKIGISILLFLTLSTAAFAQHKESDYVRAYGEYGFNYTWGHYGSAAVVGDFAVAKNFSMAVGGMLSTANVYGADVRLNYQIPLKNSAFYFENRYLGRWFARDDAQEYSLALSAGFLNYHWKFQFGVYGRFSGAMCGKAEGEKMLFEPWGLIYLGEGKAFRDDHSWNIGGRISNVNYFMIERVTMPLFTLFSDVRLSEKTKLFIEVTAHPSGTFNIQAQFYGIMGQVGIKYKW